MHPTWNSDAPPDTGSPPANLSAHLPQPSADQFEAHLLWLSDAALAPGRQYRIEMAGQSTTAVVTRLKHRLDAVSGAHLPAKTLARQELACVTLSTALPLRFVPESTLEGENRFTLLDLGGGPAVGEGRLDFALRRASNIHWQALAVDKSSRATLKTQVPQCIWLTGLSGSGKSTVANALEQRLHAAGKHTYLLDGDNVRHGLNRDLGFTEADRVENIRRVAEVAKLMVDAGLIVLVSFISPFRSERQMARQLFAPGEFIEVFVDTPLPACEARDAKGLYAKAVARYLKRLKGQPQCVTSPLLN